MAPLLINVATFIVRAGDWIYGRFGPIGIVLLMAGLGWFGLLICLVVLIAIAGGANAG